MKKTKGALLGVCSTISKFIGINPWILRILALVFFKDVFWTYLLLSFIFSIMLEDDDEEIAEK